MRADTDIRAGEEGSDMDGHANEAELKPAMAAVGFEGADATSEDDLLDMISSLEERLGDVRELHQERQDLEDELEQMRADLEARESEVEQREQLLRDSSTEIVAEKDAVQSERDRVRQEMEAVERRRAELEAKEREVGEQFAGVDQMRAQLEAAEAALRAERERREAEAEAFRREQQELAKREQELASEVEEKGGGSPEIAALAAQLAEAQKLANQRAEEAEKRAAEALERTQQLESRCRDLAGECNVVRKELEGSRAEVRRAEVEIPKQIIQRQLQRRNVDRLRRSIVTCATWLAVAIIMGAAMFSNTAGAFGDTVLMLGFAFAAYFFGSHAIAGRLFDPPAIAIGVIGGSFGWWYPLWHGAVEQAMVTWSLPTAGLGEAVAAQLPVALALMTACLAITVGAFALTWSGTLLFQMGFVSVLVGGLAMFPDGTGFALGAAAVAWHAVTGTGLTRWASRVAPQPPTITHGPISLPGGSRPGSNRGF